MIGGEFIYKLEDFSSNSSRITRVLVMVVMKYYIVVACVDDGY